MDSHTVATALRMLTALGFLERVQGCAGNADEREPNRYCLTFLPAEGVPGTGSHDYRRIKTKEEAEVILMTARLARDDSPKRVRVPSKNRIPRRASTRSQGERRTPKEGTRTLCRTLSPPCAMRRNLYISARSRPTDNAGVPPRAAWSVSWTWLLRGSWRKRWRPTFRGPAGLVARSADAISYRDDQTPAFAPRLAKNERAAVAKATGGDRDHFEPRRADRMRIDSHVALWR